MATPQPTARALANLDGVLMPLAEARVPALDRGFLFGDAVYEVLRLYGGRPWLEREHFGRLQHSLQAVGISGVDIEGLRARLHQTIAAGPFGEALAYLQVTRGVAPRQHAFPKGAAPLEFLYVQDFDDPYVAVRRSGACVITHPDQRWGRCDVKSTNLLANVLAMQAATRQDCVEALLYRPDGTLTEGSHTSFFGVLDGVVLTAPRGPAILPGITRGLILRLADRAGVALREETLSREGLGRVSELFLTGTTTEVMPIVRVDGRPVGGGRPGPVTMRLQAAYAEAVGEFVAGG